MVSDVELGNNCNVVTGRVTTLSVGGGWSSFQQHSTAMIVIFLLAGKIDEKNCHHFYNCFGVVFSVCNCSLRAPLYPRCLSQPDVMTPDPDNCHIFYQCDVNPVALSCGDMMFNTEKQV